MEKQCRRCGTPINATGNRRYCNECSELQRKALKDKHRKGADPEKNDERQRRYRERHRLALRLRFRERAKTAEHQSYVREWHSRNRFGGLRGRVLERDCHCCRACGAPYLPHKRNLVVHHIDFDPEHNSMDNLITLCRSCHPKRHQDWSEERRKAHSEALKKAGVGWWMKGRPRPPEATAKAAASTRGRKNSAEAIERMREAKREWWARQTAERKAAIGKKRRSHRNG